MIRTHMATFDVMQQWYRRQGPDGQRSARQRVLDEIESLLGVKLSVSPSGPWIRWVASAAEALEATVSSSTSPYAAELNFELIHGMTHDRSAGVSGFINELAEILLLPRAERSEYQIEAGQPEPFWIRKLLLEYATKGRHLDALTGALTKGHCAHECDRLPTGCCSVAGYDMGVMPGAMRRLQVIEARRTGWEAPAREENCRFHTVTGCNLATFKSPHCVGFLCEGLHSSLAARFAPKPLATFCEKFALFRVSAIDRSQVFDAMDDLLTAGRCLLGSREP